MILEMLMMVCFGLAWPINIYNSLKGKSTRGKNLLFLVAVDLAYVFGILYKLLYFRTWVVCIYLLNFSMVSFDLFLYFRNRHQEIQEEKIDNYYSLLC